MISAIAAGVFLASAAVPAGESLKAERNYIKEGNKAFEAGNFREALVLYDKALAVNPASDVATYNKGLSYIHLSNPDNRGQKNDPLVTGAELLDKSSKSKIPAVAEKSFYNLGNLAYNENKFQESIEYYKEALRINPDNFKTRQNLRLAQKMLENQDQNQNKDDQNKDDQDKKDQDQKQDQQQQQQQEQQKQQEQPQPTQNSQQLLQSVQNKENATRKKVNQPPKGGRRTTSKPW